MESKILSKINGLWAASLIINIITFSLIYFKIKPSSSSVALHYNVFVGVDLYGKSYNLYAIAGIGLIVNVINYLLYYFLKDTKHFLPVLTVFVSLVAQISLLMTALFLSRVN